MVGRKRSSDDEELAENERIRVYGFKLCHVFDRLSQTEGADLPKFSTVHGDPQEYLPRLIEFVANQNIVLEYDASIASAKGMSSGGKITLLPDRTPAETLATLAHEIGHLCCEDSYVAILPGTAMKGPLQPHEPPHNSGSKAP